MDRHKRWPLNLLQSVGESPCPPLFQNRAGKFPFTRLLSAAPLVMGTRLVTTTIWACDLQFHASPFQDIAPSCVAWVLALLQPYSLRSPAHRRPDVSLSWALP